MVLGVPGDQAATDALGVPVVRHGDTEYDISGAWRTVTVNDGLSDALGVTITAATPLAELVKLCEKAEVPVDPAWNRGQVILEMYEHLLEEHTMLPTFYRDFPTEVSPLTRAHRIDPRLAERWDLVAFGTEIATAYSELIDPVEQRARFTAQSLLAAGGDPEAMQLDEDFLLALEYAMPPTGGMGLGVDRMLMMFTGASIRQTVLFPFVRPQV
jgi:lysyl-tRNA synthetase class 2